MKTVVLNNAHSIKNLLTEYGIKNITEIKHDHDFIFKATTPESYITIKTEPYDDEQKYIRINSIVITLEKKALTPSEQKICLYIASYGDNLIKINEYLNSSKCAERYPADDIKSFKEMFNPKKLKQLFESYWNLDTAARDYLMEIIFNVFDVTM